MTRGSSPGDDSFESEEPSLELHCRVKHLALQVGLYCNPPGLLSGEIIFFN